jgi:hypothetical protein
VQWDWFHLVHWPLSGILYQTWKRDEMSGKGNRSTRWKSAPVLIWPPQIPDDLIWAPTLAAAIGSRRTSAELWHGLCWWQSWNYNIFILKNPKCMKRCFKFPEAGLGRHGQWSCSYRYITRICVASFASSWKWHKRQGIQNMKRNVKKMCENYHWCIM